MRYMSLVAILLTKRHSLLDFIQSSTLDCSHLTSCSPFSISWANSFIYLIFDIRAVLRPAFDVLLSSLFLFSSLQSLHVFSTPPFRIMEFSTGLTWHRSARVAHFGAIAKIWTTSGSWVTLRRGIESLLTPDFLSCL